MNTESLLSLAFGIAIETIWIVCLKYTQLARRLSDVPNARSSHQSIIPRGAGFGFALTVFGLGCFFRISILLSSMGLLMALLGLYDDMQGLRARTRFLIQALLCLVALLPAGIAGLPSLVGVLSFFLMLSAVNFYNFADGINGHLALQALINVSAWLLFASCRGLTAELLADPLAAGLIGSLLAFTWFNFYKRWVFMGDSGSTFLGFYIIAWPLQFVSAENWQIIGMAALTFSFIILTDCTLLLLAKFRSGLPLTMAHRHHFYQRLSRREGWNHERTSLVLGLWQLAISLSLIAALTINSHWAWILVLLMLLYAVCAGRSSLFARKELLVLSLYRH